MNTTQCNSVTTCTAVCPTNFRRKSLAPVLETADIVVVATRFDVYCYIQTVAGIENFEQNGGIYSADCKDSN